MLELDAGSVTPDLETEATLGSPLTVRYPALARLVSYELNASDLPMVT